MIRRIAASLLLLLPAPLKGQLPPPIIDVHLHTMAANSQGPPPLALCLPTSSFGASASGRALPAEMLTAYRDPPCAEPLWSAATDQELMEATIAIMERRNIIGIASGSRRAAWQAVAGNRLIPGTQYFFDGAPNGATVDFMRQRFAEGSVRVFAELTPQYRGMAPNDPALDPYFALAEEMDIPVGIHMGPGPPGAAYLGRPNYRAALSSPLLLEDVLVRHPGLRLYIMHAGYPMLDDLLALMWAHPHVYVGLGMLSFALPPAEFHRYLRTIVEAGYGKRVMFGSDQMVWPGALEFAIDNIESADYLTEDQKRDILYNNAARFLRLTEQEIAAHHGR
jgi:predicted TIM-barrel fold metal-dependent hydrolase